MREKCTAVLDDYVDTENKSHTSCLDDALRNSVGISVCRTVETSQSHTVSGNKRQSMTTTCITSEIQDNILKTLPLHLFEKCSFRHCHSACL